LALYSTAIQAAASELGVEVAAFEARNAADVDSAFEAFARLPKVGLVMPPSGLAVTQRELIVALAAKFGVPGVYAFRYYAEAGGLASYGVDLISEYKRAASYVDRILRGERPADLPVQYPTDFELVINLKTAKSLGLQIPESVLLTANKVIE
jgi:putative ABC transport system substrate-binding protein